MQKRKSRPAGAVFFCGILVEIMPYLIAIINNLPGNFASVPSVYKTSHEMEDKNPMKLISIILSILLAFGACATAEPAAETITGVVTEYVHGQYMVIENAQLGTVQVNLAPETPIEADRAIQAGDYVYVSFDGAMTASLPPQISAKNVVMRTLTGDVVSVDAKNNDVLIRTADGQEVLVHMPDEWKGAKIDFPTLTAYFDGAMTMSLPGQISAGMVVPGYIVDGVVEEIGEDFILIDANGQKLQVNVDSIPENLKPEDVIRMRYNGQMTNSIPAQIFALEIIRVSR